MRLHRRPASTVPADTARGARAAFPNGTPSLTLRDEVETSDAATLVADLLPQRGQPAEAPGRRAVVCVRQCAEGLADRQAADAVRRRIAWKSLLGLELDDPGVDVSVLSEFRGRLWSGGQEPRLLDDLVERCRARGLLQERGQQRTDSPPIQAAVRHLNRRACGGEPLRYALNSVGRIAPKGLKARAPPAGDKRYGARFEPYRLPKPASEREKLTLQIGQEGHPWLSWVDGADSPAQLQHGPGVEILRQGWVQPYDLEHDHLFGRQPENRPATERLLHSPDEPEARDSQKRETEWCGYNAHVTATCDDEPPPLITPVDTTLATTQDAQMTNTRHQRLAAKARWPKEHWRDRGYVETKVLMASQQRHGVEVVGPIQVDTTWPAQSGKGVEVSCCHLDWEHQRVSCPKGQVSRVWAHRQAKAGHPSIYVRLDNRSGQVCPVRPDGTRSAQGPRIVPCKPKEQDALLPWARYREQTAEVKERDAKRAGIAGTISQGRRSCCVRRSRSRGHAKPHLQPIVIAVAITLARVVAWINGESLAKTCTSPFAALAPAA